jgi:hypothetical protein
LVDLVAKSNGAKSLRDVWAEKYKVDEVRAEQHEKDILRRIEEGKKETEIRVRSEMALGGGPGGTEQDQFDSPVLKGIVPVDKRNIRGGTAHSSTVEIAQGMRERMAKIRAAGVR